MALYMDIHTRVNGMAAAGVVRAHQRNPEAHASYGVSYQRHWYDESTGKVFSLLEAPNWAAAMALHQEIHGLGTEEIVELAEAVAERGEAW